MSYRKKLWTGTVGIRETGRYRILFKLFSMELKEIIFPKKYIIMVFAPNRLFWMMKFTKDLKTQDILGNNLIKEYIVTGISFVWKHYLVLKKSKLRVNSYKSESSLLTCYYYHFNYFYNSSFNCQKNGNKNHEIGNISNLLTFCDLYSTTQLC